MEVISIADIERLLGQPRHVINHTLIRYGPRSTKRVGITRVWDMKDLVLIKDSIAKTQDCVHSRTSKLQSDDRKRR